MLSIEMARLIQDAVDIRIATGMMSENERLTIEDALKMELIPQTFSYSVHSSGVYSILALQKGKSTILARIQYKEFEGVSVKHIQTFYW